MINPGCLPCREARTSAVSAARLTLPGPAVPSCLRHALPGPDRVLQAQHRRLLQEVFQDDVEGRGLEPPNPSFRSPPSQRAGHCVLMSCTTQSSCTCWALWHGPMAGRRPGAGERMRTGVGVKDKAPDRDLRRRPPQRFHLSPPKVSLGWGPRARGAGRRPLPSPLPSTAPGPTGTPPQEAQDQDHPRRLASPIPSPWPGIWAH